MNLHLRQVRPQSAEHIADTRQRLADHTAWLAQLDLLLTETTETGGTNPCPS